MFLSLKCGLTPVHRAPGETAAHVWYYYYRGY